MKKNLTLVSYCRFNDGPDAFVRRSGMDELGMAKLIGKLMLSDERHHAAGRKNYITVDDHEVPDEAKAIIIGAATDYFVDISMSTKKRIAEDADSKSREEYERLKKIYG